VIPVYEAGEADGALFISMRFVDGADLREVIRRDTRLLPDRAAGLVAQMASALDAAHARGLVHRDVKPANVLVTGQPGSEHAYLTDFGLTKHVSSSSGITHTGQWVGTLDYVAPEQISGGALDARVDVYALGCVLFQTLTGQVPYPRESDVAKMYAHLNDPPQRVTTLAPGVPAELDAVIARALAKEPDARFPSAGDLGRAALAAASGGSNVVPERSVAAGEAAPTTPRVQPAAPTTVGPPPTAATAQIPVAQPPGWQPPPAPQRRSRWPIAAMLLALLALGGAAALVAGGAFDNSSEEPRATTVVVRETETQTAPGGTETTPDPEPGGGIATYEGATYSADYPADWSVVQSEVDKGAYTETRLRSPDAGAIVLIDRTPGAPADPTLAAREVEVQTAETSGYERITFQPVELGGRPGFEWVFDLPSGRRVDYFTTVDGVSFAVLGHGSDYATAEVVARQVAESLR
jgi:hypothetical protein